MLRLDFNLVLEIINLIIFFLLMRHFLFKPVTSIIEKRKNMIQDQIAQANESQEKANAMKAEYEAVLAGAKDQSEELIEKAKLDAKAEYDKIISEANHQAGKIVADAKIMIANEREQAVREMESQIAGLALTAAEKILNEKSGADTDQMLYDQFLEKAGDADDTDN